MKPDYNQSTVGPPSPTTEKNFKRAKSNRLDVGTTTYEWKFWTGRFFFLPFYEKAPTEMMFEGSVLWTRFYWLTFGWSRIQR
jgi:hypothetical protein